jgi:hypothetical protein
VYKFYNYCHEYDKAIQIIQMAMNHFPYDDGLRRIARYLDRKVEFEGGQVLDHRELLSK